MRTHTNSITKLYSALGSIAAFVSVPMQVQAQGWSMAETSSPQSLAVFLLFLGIGVALLHGGAQFLHLVHAGPQQVQRKSVKPHATFFSLAGTLVLAALLFLLSLKTMGGMAPFTGANGWKIAAWFFGVLGLVGTTARYVWPARSQQYVFGVIVGTLITFILIGFQRSIFSPLGTDPFLVTLGMASLILAWRFLFGPWNARVKAVVLGTFIFWVGMHLIFRESPTERKAHLLAAVVALIPAAIWCFFFLRYHRQRLGLVILMFFAGMLSTAPILLYDKLVRSGMELHFFLFRIVPENFSRAGNVFVSQNMVGVTGYKSTVAATLISFLIVGLIEELSKFWVLRKSGESEFSSIDDVLQLGIFVAIGFAFAENVLNPTYFLSFVQNYLVRPESPDWGAFMGNVLGRSILTNMVHIVSTGVLAYCYGLALFAQPYLKEAHERGRRLVIPRFFQSVLRLPERDVFRREMLTLGALAAIILHGFFNFIVTLPDLLPGRPRTVGDLLGSSVDSPFHFVGLLIVPALFYVVGGFWLLTTLFYSKENMKERGHVVHTDAFVRADRVV